MTSTRYRSANDLLKELGITEPKEIDIEAIAQHCEATVTYEPLTGCEARIVGTNDRAIITVNPSGNRGRELRRPRIGSLAPRLRSCVLQSGVSVRV
jgi:hypothetical protein